MWLWGCGGGTRALECMTSWHRPPLTSQRALMQVSHWLGASPCSSVLRRNNNHVSWYVKSWDKAVMCWECLTAGWGQGGGHGKLEAGGRESGSSQGKGFTGLFCTDHLTCHLPFFPSVLGKKIFSEFPSWRSRNESN